MACAEANVEHADLDKHFSDLKLEVTRLNWFMERETMVTPQAKTGILNTNESASTRPPLTNIADGPEGYRSDIHARDHDFASGFIQTHILANGMPYPKSNFHGLEHESTPSAQHFDLVRSEVTQN
jgi:hypothetical protein